MTDRAASAEAARVPRPAPPRPAYPRLIVVMQADPAFVPCPIDDGDDLFAMAIDHA
jgi:hypothetical protein